MDGYPKAPGALTNPYRQGADDGLWFGLYLTGLFFASAYALGVPFLGMLATLMMLAVPAIMFVRLRRTWNADRGLSLFSALWMQGIMMVGCGSLLVSVVALVYLRWINPGWLTGQVEAMVQLYGSVQGAEPVVEVLRRMLELHLLPTAIQLTVQMLWLMIFTGCILALLMTLLVRAFRPKPSDI